MTTSPPTGGHLGKAGMTPLGLHDVVTRQEHALITHLAAIEGWLGQLGDGDLDDAQRRRAACVVRKRTAALRLDLGALLHLVKEWAKCDAASDSGSHLR